MTTLAGARHIVWDWNGTIFSDNHAVVSAVNEVCTAFDREHIDLDEWRSVFSRPLLRCYERLLRRSLSNEDWARIDVLYHEAYRDLLHTCGLADGVPKVLEEWRGNGRTQSLLSMWFHDELVPMVAEFGLAELFERVDGLRAEIGGGPKAEHLERHLAELRAVPSEVVVIGDVVDDADAAAHVGAGCVLVTTGVMSRGKLAETGMPIAESIEEAVSWLS
ncbi:HAD hydrolase-like protein [Saccharopolyspora sp. K220]|uniref:HAD family hydrolase n=1 Tax=Saccharopolyspora soli TaxID=2926618 RepID=UPI001F593EAA|nr:HAD family hydrolase [Saccharopolyspora soli]MCI2421882.1 HAD hydrolase-like protein [Saccharopolyspora soli]